MLATLPMARVYRCGSFELFGRLTLLTFRLYAPGRVDHCVMVSTN